MARKNKKCACCNEQYEYCPTCGNGKLLPAWMTEFCSESCKDLWETATKFNLNMITKEVAQAKLNTLNLKPVETYTEMLQKDINNITAKPVDNKHEVVRAEKFNKAQ
jgi:hypothetical protein